MSKECRGVVLLLTVLTLSHFFAHNIVFCLGCVAHKTQPGLVVTPNNAWPRTCAPFVHTRPTERGPGYPIPGDVIMGWGGGWVGVRRVLPVSLYSQFKILWGEEEFTTHTHSHTHTHTHTHTASPPCQKEGKPDSKSGQHCVSWLHPNSRLGSRGGRGKAFVCCWLFTATVIVMIRVKDIWLFVCAEK